MESASPESSTSPRRSKNASPTNRRERRGKSKGRRSSSSPRKRKSNKKTSPMTSTITVSPRKKGESPSAGLINSYKEYPMIGNEGKVPLYTQGRNGSPTNSIRDGNTEGRIPLQTTSPIDSNFPHAQIHLEEGNPKHQESPAHETYYKLENDEISRYVRKEQQLRAHILEEENKKSRVHPQRYLTSGASQYGLQRNYSLSIQTTKTDTSSFDVNDWTPVDSSYGGAFPFCGWIPKKLRQRIEWLLLLVAGFALVYIIVSIATNLTGSSDDFGDMTRYDFDDDFYIQDDRYGGARRNNDDAEAQAYKNYYEDDDDLYNDGNRFI